MFVAKVARVYLRTKHQAGKYLPFLLSLECLDALLHELQLFLVFFSIGRRFGDLDFELLDAFGDLFQITEDKLGVEFGKIGCGVDAIAIGGDGGVLESAEDQDNHIRLANVADQF